MRWLDDLAWTTGDGPKALFDAAVGWLRKRRVLLPGVSTLARLVAIALARRDRGESITAIANHLGIGRSTLYRALADQHG